MSWFQVGYDALENRGGDYESRGPRRHWQPPDTTTRLIFISDEPFSFYEHQFKFNGRWTNWEPCKIKTRYSDSCYLCERYPDRYPYFVGLYTVINMTEWTSKKGRRYNFSREIFAAKLGSKEKPGILQKLSRMHKKYGRLRGLVFDVYRSGEKTESCGDEFDLVEKVDPSEIQAYGRKVVGEWLDDVNEELEPENQMSLDEFLKRNPWEPLDFAEIIKIRSNEELRAMFGGDDFRDDSASSMAAGDEEVPF